MDTKKRYLRFITEALLHDEVHPRRIRRHLKALQKSDPIEAPHTADEALEDWYSRHDDLLHSPAMPVPPVAPVPHTAPRKFHPRLWVGSAAALMAAVLILFIVSPQSKKSDWVTEDNAAVEQAEGTTAETPEEEAVEEEAMEEAADEEAAEYEEDAYSEEAAPTEDAAEDGTENATEDATEETSKNAGEDTMGSATDTLTMNKEELWSLIQEQYTNQENLSFTAEAAAVQEHDGYLLLKQDINIALPDAMDSSQYAGCRLQIFCEAGSYHVEEDPAIGAVVIIDEADALTITVQE